MFGEIRQALSGETSIFDWVLHAGTLVAAVLLFGPRKMPQIGRSIGRAMGELFARQGMNVVLADIEQAPLDAAVAAIEGDGHSCMGLLTDVSKADDVERLAATAMARFGGIHVACNNAGVFTGGLLWQESVADYQWLMDVNVWGVIHGIRSFVSRMQAQGEECHVVNTASMAALTAMPYSGIYHMTKHAVLAMSDHSTQASS